MRLTRSVFVARAVLCLTAGAALSGLLTKAIRWQLSGRFDIIGTAQFTNFDADALFDTYYLMMLAPFFAGGLYTFLQRSVPARSVAVRWSALGLAALSWLPVGIVAAGEQLTSGVAPASMLAGTIFLGMSWSLALASLVGHLPWSFETLLRVLTTLNACLAPVWLTALSNITWVSAPDHGSRAFPWFPAWMAVPLSVVATARVLMLLRRRATLERAQSWAVGVVLVPVLIFATWVDLLPPGMTIDPFHDGETLAAGELMFRGAFPWRDFAFIHGLLHDPLRSFLGYRFYGHDTYSGLITQPLLLQPLYAVGFYFALRVVTPRPALFSIVMGLVGPFALAPSGLLPFHLRLVVLFPLLVCFSAAVRTRGSAWTVAYVLAGVVAAITVPESSYFVAASAPCFVAAEMIRRPTGAPWWRLPKTAVAAITAGATVAIFLTWLGVYDSVQAFVDYYRVFANGHRYKGAISPQWNSHPIYNTLAIAMPLITAVWILSTFVLGRRLFYRPEHWTLHLLALGMLGYYGKFLSRADMHVVHPFAIASILGIGMLPVLVRESVRYSHYVKGQWLACAAIAWFGLSVTIDRAFNVTARLKRGDSAAPSPVTGFVRLDAGSQALYNDFQHFFDAYEKPEDPFFDFTNNPAFFHHLLGRKPASRYYHISMAMNVQAQAQLIDDLERTRPRFVTYYTERYFAAWDGVPNVVRHWRVAEYVNQHYEPFVVLSGYLVLVRRDLQLQAPRERGLSLGEVSERLSWATTAEACQWGSSLEFLRSDLVAPQRTEHVVEVACSRVGGVCTIVRPDRARLLILTFATRNDREVRLDPGGERPLRVITASQLATDDVTITIPVASCPEWFATQDDRWTISTSDDAVLMRVEAVTSTP
ncbi:MAG: hypothetical protein IT381_00655 [Deltaproteobacteria bacterium]|nr:hypothetical protein [Deltaproteobacteria bacterium]